MDKPRPEGILVPIRYEGLPNLPALSPNDRRMIDDELSGLFDTTQKLTIDSVRLRYLAEPVQQSQSLSLDPVVYVLRLSIRDWPTRRLDLFGVPKAYARAISS